MCPLPYEPGSHRMETTNRAGWKQGLCHRYLRHRQHLMRNHQPLGSKGSGRYTPPTQEQLLVMDRDHTGGARTVHPSLPHKSTARIWAAKDSDNIILRTMLKSHPRARVSKAGSHAPRSKALVAIRHTIQLDIRTREADLRRMSRIVLRKASPHKAFDL
jgi:hypothetical protein